MRQAVTCSICLAIFDQPVILPNCGHSFCYRCIKQVIGDRKTKVACPECRVESKLGDRGVNSLHNNFSAGQVVELLKESNIREPVRKTHLSLSSKCSHTSRWKQNCSHCDSKFCPSCLVAHAELLKMSASWISSRFSSRYIAALQTLDGSFDNARKEIENQIQDAKSRVEKEADSLLSKLRDVIEGRKEELFMEIESMLQRQLCDLQSTRDLVPTQQNVYSVVSQVKEMAQNSPLFLNIKNMADVHNLALATDKQLRNIENLASGKDMKHIKILTDPDPDLLAAEVANVLKAELRVELVTDSCEELAAEEERFLNACRNGDLQAVKETLERNSLPLGCRDYILSFKENTDNFPLSSLALAVTSGNFALVRYLVEEAGADIWFVNFDYFAFSSARFNPSDDADYLGIVKYVVEKEPDLLKIVDYGEVYFNVNTALHWAARNGLVDVIKFLVKEKGCDVNAENSGAATPLLHAAEHPEAINALIELDADVESCDMGYSCIADRVACFGDVETFKFLHQLSPQLTSYHASARDSLLCAAASEGHYDLVAFILENCANEFSNSDELPDENVVTDKARLQKEVLEILVSKNDQPVILELLADHGGAKLDLKLHGGSTLLHEASRLGKSRIVRMLLKRFPGLLKQKNDNGEMAIDLALKSRCHRLVRYLASCHQLDPENDNTL